MSNHLKMLFKINNIWDTGRVLKFKMNQFCLLWVNFLPREVPYAAFQKCVLNRVGKIASVLNRIVKVLPASSRMCSSHLYP